MRKGALAGVGALLLLLTLSGLAACSGGSMPMTHYYVLRPPSEPGASVGDAETAAGLRVGVDSIAVDPPYDQDRLVYRQRADSPEVGFYAYHRWASPLGRLLQVALADGLAEVPGIALIEPTRSGREYDARLGGRLIVLEEVALPAGQEVRLSLELVMSDGDGEELWSTSLAESAAGSAAGVPQVIELAQRAFATALSQAEEELTATLAAAGDSR